MKQFNFYIPTRIFFGEGAVQKLSRARLPEGKGLIITGGTSTTKLGYVAKVADILKECGHETVVYNKVQPNPTLESVRECTAVCRENGCTFLVGLGGGSSIDTAKAVAVMANNDGDWWDYVYGGTGGRQRAKNAGLALVAITTTAGTGTEVDPWTVISNGEEKIGAGNDRMFPTVAIVDADFMVSVPPHLTAYQGFDALFHATEGYLASCANPMSDMFALEAIRRIGNSLVTAVNNGQDKQARAEVALANTLSGFILSISSCIGNHAVEHALSAFHPGLPHGAGLIMLSQAYYKRHLSCSAERMVQMAKALGNEAASKPQDFLDALIQMQKDCGVDALKMSDYGIMRDNFAAYADNAFENSGGMFRLDTYPFTKEEVIAMLEESYQ